MSYSRVDFPRRVSHALTESIREELKKVEEQCIIIAVEEATDCVNSLEKLGGFLLLCLDTKQLNKHIHTEDF